MRTRNPFRNPGKPDTRVKIGIQIKVFVTEEREGSGLCITRGTFVLLLQLCRKHRGLAT